MDRSSETQAAEKNVGEFRRKISGIVRIKNRAELEQVLAEANRARTPLYPFSRGCNWGYGSKLPAASEGGTLVDLSALDRINDIDEEQGVATIEPGVSQRQLAAELQRRGSRYYLDVTGSGADTSVIGNALERGIAYSSIRAQQITGLEVMLASGETFRTGFGGFAHSVLAGLYPYGLGPMVDGLFFQSNLGIVLEAKVQLSLRPEKLFALTVSVDDRSLSEFVERAARLKRQGYLHGIPHLADRERTVSTIAPLVMDVEKKMSAVKARAMVNRVVDSDWTLTAAVTGAGPLALAKLQRIRSELAPLGKIFVHEFEQPAWKKRLGEWLIRMFANREQQLVIAAAAPLREFHRGQPSDAGVRFLQEDGKPVDEGSEGFLLCTPLAPLTGKNAETLRQIAREESARYQVRFAMTQNLITERVLEGVISVHFARATQAERDRAHECVHAMTKRFEALGFYPYRVNIDQMVDRPRSVALADVLRAVKQALDPNGIIAPGRYD